MSRFRSAAVQHGEMAAARAARALSALHIGFWGEVSNYNPTTGAIQVAYSHTADLPTTTQWIPLGHQFGCKGYGDQWYPEVGAQVLLLQLSPRGDDLVALVFGFNAEDAPPKPDLKPGERFINDRNGSSLYWSQDGPEQDDGQQGLRAHGAGYASLTSGNGGPTEVGDENLDPTEQAGWRNKDWVAGVQWAWTQLAAQIAATCQAGSGADIGPCPTPPNFGSQKVRIAD